MAGVLFRIILSMRGGQSHPRRPRCPLCLGLDGWPALLAGLGHGLGMGLPTLTGAQINNGRLVGIRFSLWVLAKNLGLFPRLFPRFAGAGSGLGLLRCPRWAVLGLSLGLAGLGGLGLDSGAVRAFDGEGMPGPCLARKTAPAG